MTSPPPESSTTGLVGPHLLTNRIIGAAITVHRELGPGLLERTYEDCLSEELRLRDIAYERQKRLPVIYKGRRVGDSYRMDLLVEEEVVVEVKAIARLTGLDMAQILTYMKLSGHDTGLIINFNVPLLKDGIRRVVN